MKFKFLIYTCTVCAEQNKFFLHFCRDTFTAIAKNQKYSLQERERGMVKMGLARMSNVKKYHSTLLSTLFDCLPSILFYFV